MGKIIILILMFAVLVLVHEWGHYIAAKKNGVLVHEFAIGMGPKIWSKQKGETLYSIRILPIGGFCNMEGEVGDNTNPRAMSAKKPWRRLVILAAGAFMNFLLAWILLTIVVGYQGYPGNIIATLEDNMPAKMIGMQIGDKVVAVDGKSIKDLSDIQKATKDMDKTYTFEVEREGEGTFKFQMKPKWIEQEGRARFGFGSQFVKPSFFKQMEEGLKSTGTVIYQVWGGFIQMITGKVNMKEVAGIVGVVQIGANYWDSGMKIGLEAAIMNILYLAALLSANLGVLNLLPFPALDGGRILFTLIEMVCGKPVDPEKEGMFHFVGFVLLMALMVFVLYNDIMRLIP